MAARNSKKYRKIYEKHYGVTLPSGIEIHHVDGNKDNNAPKNLLALTIEEHYAIHESQGDWRACKAISLRMDTTFEERSNMSKQLWRDTPPGRIPVTNGTKTKQLKTERDVEVFLENTPGWYRGRAISETSDFRKTGKRKMADGTHVMLQTSKCPFCEKEGHAVVMKRWHFNNCKYNKGAQ